MRNPHGQAEWIGVEGTRENRVRDTITCVHCNGVVFVDPKPGAEPNHGFCLKCMSQICGPCADLNTCVPFEKQLEAIERGISRQQFFRSLGID